MANLTCTVPVEHPARVIEMPRRVRAGDILRAAAEQLLLWQERSEQRRRLADLEAHLLSDIGLSRDEVEAEIRKPFWQA